MKNNLLGKKFFSCSFYLYRFRKYVSYSFLIINFCNPGWNALYYFIIVLCTVFEFGDGSIDICLLYCIVLVCFVCVLCVSCPTVVWQNLWTYEMLCLYVCMYVCISTDFPYNDRQNTSNVFSHFPAVGYWPIVLVSLLIKSHIKLFFEITVINGRPN